MRARGDRMRDGPESHGPAEVNSDRNNRKLASRGNIGITYESRPAREQSRRARAEHVKVTSFACCEISTGAGRSTFTSPARTTTRSYGLHRAAPRLPMWAKR